VLALKANALNSLISRGLLQTQREASTITLGLHTAEAGRNPRASLGHNATKNDFKFPPKGLRRLVLRCMPSKSGGNITFMAFGACLCASNSSSFTNLHSFESQGDTALPVYDRSA